MEDRHGSGSGIVRQHSGIWMSLRDEDFEEEEVWDVFKNTDNYGISKSKLEQAAAAAPPVVPVPPMKPRWFYRNLHLHCRDVDDNDEEDEDEDEEGDEFDSKLPPHEFIARRLARSHISSFSVFEGVGRTLKGRDLSKVRNAVLTKTGFLESL
ncbi:hypothetical protein K1719_020456 [Acacia pycnantha]|nr:hypothetical protein K1719_020456 [Acacia pycnantha]